jgi:hypothetical protein
MASRAQQVPEPEPAPLFKLKQFQNASPAIQTFRSGEERTRALSYQTLDGAARTGMFKQGLYAVELGS